LQISWKSRGERDLFQRRLGAMQRDGQLMLTAAPAVSAGQAGPDQGRVEGTRTASAFVVPEEAATTFICRPGNAPGAARRPVMVRVAGFDARGGARRRSSRCSRRQ